MTHHNDFSSMSESNDRDDDDSEYGNKMSMGSKESSNNMDINSVSSTSSATGVFSNVIRDFKKTLNDREMPKNLVLLNRVISSMLIITLVLTCVDYFQTMSQVSFIFSENYHNLNSERRTLSIVQLASNVRTSINIANKMAKGSFSLESLNKIIDRHDFVLGLIQSQAAEL